MGRYGHDAKLLQRPAELGRLLSSCELLRDRPGRRGVVLSRLTAEALYACPAEGYALVAEEQLLEVAVVAGGVAARAQLGH